MFGIFEILCSYHVILQGPDFSLLQMIKSQWLGLWNVDIVNSKYPLWIYFSSLFFMLTDSGFFFSLVPTQQVRDMGLNPPLHYYFFILIHWSLFFIIFSFMLHVGLLPSLLLCLFVYGERKLWFFSLLPDYLLGSSF